MTLSRVRRAGFYFLVFVGIVVERLGYLRLRQYSSTQSLDTTILGYHKLGNLY